MLHESKILPVVTPFPEDSDTKVAALSYMMRNAGHYQSGESCHALMLLTNAAFSRTGIERVQDAITLSNHHDIDWS